MVILFNFPPLISHKRQQDAAFASMLNKVRLGIVDEEVIRVLRSRVVGDNEIDLRNGCIMVALQREKDYWNQTYVFLATAYS